MGPVKIYHNPRCSKSRMAVEYLHAKSIPFETILYLNHELTENEIKEVLKKLKLIAHELLRKGEDEYKIWIKNKELSENDIIKLMIQFPNLMERPIVIYGEKAVVARPADLIDTIV